MGPGNKRRIRRVILPFRPVGENPVEGALEYCEIEKASGQLDAVEGDEFCREGRSVETADSIGGAEHLDGTPGHLESGGEPGYKRLGEIHYALIMRRIEKQSEYANLRGEYQHRGEELTIR
jgi:hypothetical protein